MARNVKNIKKEQDDLVDRLIFINRVTKVVKGGKNMSFAAIVVVGDQNGKVGFGTGKAREVPDAVRKATDAAKKGLIKVPLKEGRTLHHDVTAKFASGHVVLRSAPTGTGIIAGGPMRAVFEVLGIQDIVAKSLGSTNPHNMIRATFAAFEKLYSPKSVADRRGKKVGEIVSRRDTHLGNKSEVVESAE